MKWGFTGSVPHPLVRYLWYGFYVGMLFVPALGAFIINYLGKPEDYSHPRKLNYLLIPSTIMLIAVFTNDLHQKVFVFYKGFINFDLEYSYDWFYYIVMGFCFVVMMLLQYACSFLRNLIDFTKNRQYNFYRKFIWTEAVP